MSEGALWTSSEAARATGGRCTLQWAASGVSIDSRTLVPGDLFVALKGPRFDGHDFAAEASAKGAAALLLERVPKDIAPEAPLLLVEDTLAALRALGAAGRARTKASVLAVTGSVGKTGTKEMLRAALEEQAPTFASAQSHNNEVGVPLNLARMPRASEYGVFEVGMNHPGEIAPLARLLRPRLAIITTIEPAHLETLSSLEAIADAKAEIFEAMGPEDVAVLNRDNPQFDRLARAARERGLRRIIGFGESELAEARLLGLGLRPDRTEVKAEIEGRRLTYVLGLPGAHWAMNSLAVLAAVRAVGADPIRGARALGALKPFRGRGARHRIALSGGSFELIDESYNASPASMRAAIALLAAAPVGARGRRVAVLGDMLELGSEAPALHAALAGPLEEAGVDLVFTAGATMRHLRDALPFALRGGHGRSSRDLIPPLLRALRPGDVVMVKGSAATRMGLVVEALFACARDGARHAAAGA